MSPRYGFLSTHPPTRCGLATFSQALAAHLGTGERRVVRVVTGPDSGAAAPGVVHTWPAYPAGGWRAAAAALNGFDVAVVQHEYGIYPGRDGEDIVPLLQHLTVPSIVVLHTVLTNPTTRQRELLEQIATAASAVVTMTGAAKDRLVSGYDVVPGKVNVIPHGAADHTGTPAAQRHRSHLLTWGLIGPGKGIEWGVRALAQLQDLKPAPVYTVAGKTHPKVLELRGEAYRTSVQRLAATLGVGRAVRFDPAYRDTAALSRLIRSADVVVLPYDSREQVTSGVLIEAVGAGVPVVATRFPHAIELLEGGGGLLVPHRDVPALAAAIRRILVEPGLGQQLTHTGDRPLLWPAVAARYEALARKLLAPDSRPLVTASA
jgi:glycosyltransferase involved in cell wall biosynthesis